MEHRWVLIMSCNACGFASSGCAAHRDTFAKAGTAHSIFDSFTSFTGCSYVVCRSFIGASCIQLLRWKHKIWKVLNSYERHHDFITTSATSCLQGRSNPGERRHLRWNAPFAHSGAQHSTIHFAETLLLVPCLIYMYADLYHLYHLVFFDGQCFIFSKYILIFMFIIFLCCCHNRWRMLKTLKFAKSRCRIASTMVFRRFRCVVPNLQP